VSGRVIDVTAEADPKAKDAIATTVLPSRVLGTVIAPVHAEVPVIVAVDPEVVYV
jgi:hypothetical protein